MTESKEQMTPKLPHCNDPENWDSSEEEQLYSSQTASSNTTPKKRRTYKEVEDTAILNFFCDNPSYSINKGIRHLVENKVS